MTTLRLNVGILAAGMALAPHIGFASGSVSMPLGGRTGQKLTPAQEAVQLYNDGISYRDKAAKLEKEAAAETDARKKDKLLAKAIDRHESSIEKFVQATRKNATLFQAWGSLGYAYRRTSKYAQALEAYNKALEIQSDYTPAIEYRAEAFLALNRLDDVKVAYMALFRLDRPRADELTAAIDHWVEERRQEPGGLTPDAVEGFSRWMTERKQLASQTSSLLPGRDW